MGSKWIPISKVSANCNFFMLFSLFVPLNLFQSLDELFSLGNSREFQGAVNDQGGRRHHTVFLHGIGLPADVDLPDLEWAAFRLGLVYRLVGQFLGLPALASARGGDDEDGSHNVFSFRTGDRSAVGRPLRERRRQQNRKSPMPSRTPPLAVQ